MVLQLEEGAGVRAQVSVPSPAGTPRQVCLHLGTARFGEVHNWQNNRKKSELDLLRSRQVLFWRESVRVPGGTAA